jgi:hypothetical protein
MNKNKKYKPPSSRTQSGNSPSKPKPNPYAAWRHFRWHYIALSEAVYLVLENFGSPDMHLLGVRECDAPLVAFTCTSHCKELETRIRSSDISSSKKKRLLSAAGFARRSHVHAVRLITQCTSARQKLNRRVELLAAGADLALAAKWLEAVADWYNGKIVDWGLSKKMARKVARQS